MITHLCRIPILTISLKAFFHSFVNANIELAVGGRYNLVNNKVNVMIL